MNAFAPRQAGSGKQLRAERTPVSVEASMMTMSAYQYPELADISLRGAKLRGPNLPPAGAKALLRAGDLEVLCRVMWAKDGHCGIYFEEPVHPSIVAQIRMDSSVTLGTDGPVAPCSNVGEAMPFTAK